MRDIWRTSIGLRIAAVLYNAGALAAAYSIVGVANKDGALWQGVAFASAAVVFPALVGLRFALRARVELRADALIVVTTFSDHRFAWTDISDAQPGYAGVTLLLKDGTTFLAGAVQKANASSWLKRESRADLLARAIVEKARAAA